MVLEKQKQKKISLLEKWNIEMNLIQEKTGIKGIYVVLALIISVVLVYLNIFDSVITNLVGTLYPAFWTIKSIENDNLQEQKNWLIYWAVFGFFILIDMFSPIIVKFVPFYLVMKILFLIWMFMPGSNGSKMVYGLIVKKILKRYETDFNNVVNNVGEVFQREGDANSSILRKGRTKNINWKDVNKTALLLRNKEKIEELENEEENDKIGRASCRERV